MGLNLGDLYNTVLYTSSKGINLDIIEEFHALDIAIQHSQVLVVQGSLIRHPGD